MLGYATRYVISQTLRRFLRKYLLDVDVEDVAVNIKGGGVRLSNVQLREGVVLTMLCACSDEKAKDEKEVKAKDERKEEAGVREEKSSLSPVVFSSKRVKNAGSLQEVNLNTLEANCFLKEEVREESEEMALMVGKGGVIGTLDIRLVGKDLYVSIQDADIVLHADNPNHKPAYAASSSFDSSAAPAAPAAPAESGSGETQPNSVDKISKISKFSKMLNNVPNLKLVDCRIRLILPSTESQPKNLVLLLGIDSLNLFTHSSPHPIPPYQNNSLHLHIGNNKPQNGLYIQRFAPPHKHQTTATTKWARHDYIHSSQMCLFKCSNLTLQAQLTTPLLASSPPSAPPTQPNQDHACPSRQEQTAAALYTDEYDDFTMDSMLFGVDAPISSYQHPASNHLTTHATAHTHPNTHQHTNNPFQSQFNIQTLPIPSNFHKFSKRMQRNSCNTCNHSPLTDCPSCWNNYNSNNLNHTLDSSMPLPGLVIYIQGAEPIEFNLDRPTLETLALLKHLFSPPSNPSSSTSTSADHQIQAKSSNDTNDHSHSIPTKNTPDCSHHNNNHQNTSYPSFMTPDSIYIFGASFAKVTLRLHKMTSTNTNNKTKQTQPQTDIGYTFCYWETIAQSITIDVQQSIATQLPFTDLKTEIASFYIYEKIGAGGIRTFLSTSPAATADATANNNNSSKCNDGIDIEISSSFECMASKILNLGTETSPSSSLDRNKQNNQEGDDCSKHDTTTAATPTEYNHGLQLRLIHAPPLPNVSTENNTHDSTKTNQTTTTTHISSAKHEQTDNDHDITVKKSNFINIKTGIIHIDIHSNIRTEISKVIEEIKYVLNGGKATNSTTTTTTTSASSNSSPQQHEKTNTNTILTHWTYKIHLDSGSMIYDPRIRFKFPNNFQFVGQKCPTKGISIDTILNHVHFNYGLRSNTIPSSSSSASSTNNNNNNNNNTIAAGFGYGGKQEKQLRFFDIPDKLRMRIFLFLDDLTPLAKAICMKKMPDSFLLGHSINKRITKMASSFSSLSSAKKSSSKDATRNADKKLKKTRKTATAQRKLHRKVPSSSTISSTSSSTSSKKNQDRKKKKLLAKLSKLDNDSLEQLLVIHNQNKKELCAES